MSMVVKAFLERGDKPEIRRFPVDQEVASNYAFLAKKIATVFPGLREGHFTLHWKDPENDIICFSSDDELVEALGFVQDGVFRVHVKEVQGSGPENEGVHHPGVTCDGCEKAVYGTRFKCLVCPDYDLCSVCQGQGTHPEHEMLRITNPESTPHWLFHFLQKGQGRGRGRGGHGRGGHGHHGHGFHGPPPPPPPPPFGAPPFGAPPFECHFGGSFGPFGPFGGPEGSEGPAGGPNGGPFPGPHGPHGGPHGGPPPHWARWWRRFMKRMYNQQQGEGEQSKEEQQEGAEDASGGQEKESYANNGAGDNPADEMLRNVGESVAAMLDPLGIDVMVDVETPDGTRRRCHKRGMGGQGGGRGGCKGRGGHGDGGCKKGKGWKKMNKEGEKDDEVEKMEEEEEVNNDKEEVQRDGAADGETTLTQKMADIDIVEKEASPKSSSPDTEWTLLQKPHPEPSPSQSDKPSTEGTSQIYPSVPLEPEAPSDPKIAEALQQMLAMGFNNEGGWLTHLLEYHQGDIIRVLDALKPGANNRA